MPSWQRQELRRKQPGASGDLPQPTGAVQSDRSLATRVAEEAGLVEGLVLRDHRSLTDILGLLGDSHLFVPHSWSQEQVTGLPRHLPCTQSVMEPFPFTATGPLFPEEA